MNTTTYTEHEYELLQELAIDLGVFAQCNEELYNAEQEFIKYLNRHDISVSSAYQHADNHLSRFLKYMGY